MDYHWKSRKNPTAPVQNSGLPAVKSNLLNSAMEKSACTASGKQRCSQGEQRYTVQNRKYETIQQSPVSFMGYIFMI